MPSVSHEKSGWEGLYKNVNVTAAEEDDQVSYRLKLSWVVCEEQGHRYCAKSRTPSFLYIPAAEEVSPAQIHGLEKQHSSWWQEAQCTVRGLSGDHAQGAWAEITLWEAWVRESHCMEPEWDHTARSLGLVAAIFLQMICQENNRDVCLSLPLRFT